MKMKDFKLKVQEEDKAYHGKMAGEKL